MSSKKLGERIFLFTMRCLGVGVFKKYWPTKGSYWNSDHIDKNDLRDLERIINQSDDNINLHAKAFASEIILSGGSFLWKIQKPVDNLKFLGLCSLVHLYALGVQTYNKILAANRIHELKLQQNPNQPTEEQVEHREQEEKERLNTLNKNQTLKVIKSSFGYQLYYRDFLPVGPSLNNCSKLLLFRDYYMQKFTGSKMEEFQEFYYITEANQLYQAFLLSLITM